MESVKDILLTVEDVAAILKVQTRTVRDWIKQGKIAFIRLPGGDYRIKQENFNRWLEMKTVKPTL